MLECNTNDHGYLYSKHGISIPSDYNFYYLFHYVHVLHWKSLKTSTSQHSTVRSHNTIILHCRVLTFMLECNANSYGYLYSKHGISIPSDCNFYYLFRCVHVLHWKSIKTSTSQHRTVRAHDTIILHYRVLTFMLECNTNAYGYLYSKHGISIPSDCNFYYLFRYVHVLHWKSLKTSTSQHITVRAHDTIILHYRVLTHSHVMTTKNEDVCVCARVCADMTT